MQSDPEVNKIKMISEINDYDTLIIPSGYPYDRNVSWLVGTLTLLLSSFDHSNTRKVALKTLYLPISYGC